MKFRNILVYSLLVMAACSTLPYQDDTAFAVSAQANSPEFPVYVGGSLCKDMDGNPGMCSKRITSTTALAIHIDPQAYAYDLTVACTSPIIFPGATVPANQALDLSLQPAQMQGLLTYICRGEVFPQDRAQPLSAIFEVRVDVVDAAYIPAPQMLTTQDEKSKQWSLVLGEYARNSWVCDQGKCKAYSKDTIVPISAPANVQAYSESYNMRENYFQWAGPVQ
jgi:hypothetical protein